MLCPENVCCSKTCAREMCETNRIPNFSQAQNQPSVESNYTILVFFHFQIRYVVNLMIAMIYLACYFSMAQLIKWVWCCYENCLSKFKNLSDRSTRILYRRCNKTGVACSVSCCVVCSPPLNCSLLCGQLEMKRWRGTLQCR